MPPITVTEAARRVGWKPNKSGRESFASWFLASEEQREFLKYETLTEKGTVDEEAFATAFGVWQEQRRQGRPSPKTNLGAYAVKGMTRSEQAALQRSNRSRPKKDTGNWSPGRGWLAEARIRLARTLR